MIIVGIILSVVIGVIAAPVHARAHDGRVHAVSRHGCRRDCSLRGDALPERRPSFHHPAHLQQDGAAAAGREPGGVDHLHALLPGGAAPRVRLRARHIRHAELPAPGRAARGALAIVRSHLCPWRLHLAGRRRQGEMPILWLLGAARGLARAYRSFFSRRRRRCSSTGSPVPASRVPTTPISSTRPATRAAFSPCSRTPCSSSRRSRCASSGALDLGIRASVRGDCGCAGPPRGRTGGSADGSRDGTSGSVEQQTTVGRSGVRALQPAPRRHDLHQHRYRRDSVHLGDPAASYLLTFILVFASRTPVSPMRLMVPPAAVAGLPIFLSWYWGLGCRAARVPRAPSRRVLRHRDVCHGELARRRPPAAGLTEFYFWLSLGVRSVA